MINARPCPTKVSCTVLVPNVAPVDAEEPAGFFSSEVDDPFVPPPPKPKEPPPPCVGPGCFPPPNINGDTPTPYRPTTDDPPPNNPPPTINQDPNTPVFLNELQTCGAECPDGSSSEHTVAAGIYRGATQAQANEIALSICEKEAGAQALCFQTTSLPDVCKDSSYNQTIVATGGTPHVNFAYDWEITAGALPGGITLNPISGALTGNATSSGAFTFTVRITDAAGQAKSASFSINVIEITSATTLPSGVVGTAYESLNGFTFTESPALTGTWTVAGGSFPSGMVVNPTTGVVSGTPTTDGLYNFTIGFNTDAGQCTKACSVRIYKADGVTTGSFPIRSNQTIALGVLQIGLYKIEYLAAGSPLAVGFNGGVCPDGNWMGIAGGPSGDCAVLPLSLNPVGDMAGFSTHAAAAAAAQAATETAMLASNPLRVAGRRYWELTAAVAVSCVSPNYLGPTITYCGCTNWSTDGGGTLNFQWTRVGKL